MPSLHNILKRKITFKIKNQLYSVYLLGILIPITIVSCYLILNTHSLLIKHHTAQINSDNLRVRSIMLDITTSIKNIADEIFSDEQLMEILSTTYDSSQEAIVAIGNYDKFNKYISRYAEISSITIYTMNDTINDYANFKKITPEMLRADWFKEAFNTARYLWHTRTVTDAKGGNLANELSVSYRIPVTQRGDYALLVLNISNNYLKSRINNNSFNTIISVNKDPIFYGNEKKLNETLALPINYEQKYSTFSGDALYNGEITLTELSTLIPIQSQDKLYIVTIDTKALKDIRRIVYIFIGTLSFSIFVPLLIVIFYANHFSNRINTLRSEMHKVSKGDYNIIHGFTGNDELSEVYTDLTTMITSIKEMDKEIYEGKISQQYILLNFLWLICCLPIVTIGASTTALYYVTMQTAREEDSYIARSFFRSFKENFKQSTIIWIIMFFIGAILTFNVAFWFTMKSTIGNVLGTLISIALLLYVFTLFYIFPLLSRFNNTVKQTMKNALFISLQNLKQTLIITVVNVLIVLVIYLLPISTVFFLLFGFAFFAYLNSFQFVKVFKCYESESNEDSSDVGANIEEILLPNDETVQ